MGKTINNIAGLDMSHDWVEIYPRHLECSKCGVFQAEDAPPVGYPCPENGKESRTIDRSYIVANDPLMQESGEANAESTEEVLKREIPMIALEKVDISAQFRGDPNIYVFLSNEAGKKAIEVLPDLLRAAKALLEEELVDDRSKDKEMFFKMTALELALKKAGIEI